MLKTGAQGYHLQATRFAAATGRPRLASGKPQRGAPVATWAAWRRLPATLLRIALLTIAYAVVGVPALQLAIPPGYGAPIFPPAGIMLAAGVIYGYGVLPAAFFGSLLLRLTAFSGVSAGHTTLQWVSLIVALAAMLQAAVGTRLVKGLCGASPALDTPATIVRFVLLCPVAALVSASISTLALLKSGIAAPISGFFYWWNWWLGDTLGMLVGVPIVLALLGRPREHWRARRWTVAIPLLVMIGLGALTAAMIARWEDQRIEGRFGFDAQKLVNAFRSELRLDVLADQAAEFLVWIPDSEPPSGAGTAARKLAYAVININRLDPRLLVNDGGGLAICWVDRTGGGAAHRIADRKSVV